MYGKLSFILTALVVLLSASTGRASTVLYKAQAPDGKLFIGCFLHDRVVIPRDSEVLLFLDRSCESCSGRIAELYVDNQSLIIGPQIKPFSLPCTLGQLSGSLGAGLGHESRVTIVVQIHSPQGDGGTTEEERMTFLFPPATPIGQDLSAAEPPQAAPAQAQAPLSDKTPSALPPVVVADTVAYAVTRQSGNTAIAGLGVFFSLPFLKKVRWLRWSFVAHFLPPAQQGTEIGSAADLGISPIGIGLFDNKMVVGLGWNLSRSGQRPEKHNRYFYVGFSPSQMFSTTRSKSTVFSGVKSK